MIWCLTTGAAVLNCGYRIAHAVDKVGQHHWQSCNNFFLKNKEIVIEVWSKIVVSHALQQSQTLHIHMRMLCCPYPTSMTHWNRQSVQHLQFSFGRNAVLSLSNKWLGDIIMYRDNILWCFLHCLASNTCDCEFLIQETYLYLHFLPHLDSVRIYIWLSINIVDWYTHTCKWNSKIHTKHIWDIAPLRSKSFSWKTSSFAQSP